MSHDDKALRKPFWDTGKGAVNENMHGAIFEIVNEIGMTKTDQLLKLLPNIKHEKPLVVVFAIHQGIRGDDPFPVSVLSSSGFLNEVSQLVSL